MDIEQFDMDAFRYAVLVDDPLVNDIWKDKYRWKQPDGTSAEDNVMATRERVVEAVYANDHEVAHKLEAHRMVQGGYFIPAGRVNAGAGTGRAVTMINCYVSPTIQDSLPGIQLNIAQAALTMQQGGGIGSDYSSIRPAGALVVRTGSVASGIIPFADQQSAMCDTIMSAGTRRGAMMLTLRDDHPDLWNERQFETHKHPATGELCLTHPSFISAKRQKGRLTGFNVSVLVSDAFMRAVEGNAMWDLGFHVPPADGKYVDVYAKPFPYDECEISNEFERSYVSTKIKGRPYPWYVYRRVPARTIWEDIMRSTYKYAEPGVIFIERVNKLNNLVYCEDIRCTNPCGEQPLPPNGACCLGSVNLAFMVKQPFTEDAEIDWELYRRAIQVGVRSLDNVLGVTNYPLKAQLEESMQKRRIGLGVTGFGDMLVQMGIRYGSPESVVYARELSKMLQLVSYETSMELAKERGPFPLFKAQEFCNSPNVKKLPSKLQDDIRKHGIRNGVLNTIAPNGTISIYTGNVSSGHEPHFSYAPVTRNVRQPDGSALEYESIPYALRLYRDMHMPNTKFTALNLPDYFVGAMDIPVSEHVDVHAAWQEHIDASISKTINCPTGMDYDDFKAVYDRAYELGCKGCTTYRFDPDSGRGSVLKMDTDDGVDMTPRNEDTWEAEGDFKDYAAIEVMPAQRVVEGRRYKLKWPTTGENWYITVTRHNEQPFEVFITSSNTAHIEWVQAMSRLITAVLRRGGDVRFLIHQLDAVHSAHGGAFVAEQHKYRPSVVAAIGGILEEEFRVLGLYGEVVEQVEPKADASKVVPVTVTFGGGSDSCPNCGATPILREAGCERCLNCDWNRCG